jgi:hypothetical protein
LDDEKNLHKGRNSYLYSFIKDYGDDLPLSGLVRLALSYTSYTFDDTKCKDLKIVMLRLLGVTDDKGKILKNIEDGCSGWFRVSMDTEKSELSEEFYMSVDSVVMKHFDDKDDLKQNCSMSASAMVDCLSGWHKMGFTSGFIKIIFEKQFYYVLFDEELLDMKLFIERFKLNQTKTKDKVAMACLNMVNAIIKANSVLPAGFSWYQKSQADKIFNIENAGLGSVPYLMEFGLSTENKTNESEPHVVTPNKVKTQNMNVTRKRFSKAAKKTVSSVKKRKENDVDNEEFVDNYEEKEEEEDYESTEEEEHGKEDFATKRVRKERHVEDSVVPLLQSHSGKSSILAMIAAQAPVLHRTSVQENKKKLCISFTTPIRQANGIYKVAMFIDSANNGNQIYTWKAKPLVHAFGIAKLLDNLVLGDKNDSYCSLITNQIN